jgi:hypothetical protein
LTKAKKCVIVVVKFRRIVMKMMSLREAGFLLGLVAIGGIGVTLMRPNNAVQSTTPAPVISQAELKAEAPTAIQSRTASADLTTKKTASITFDKSSDKLDEIALKLGSGDLKIYALYTNPQTVDNGYEVAEISLNVKDFASADQVIVSALAILKQQNGISEIKRIGFSNFDSTLKPGKQTYKFKLE